MEIKTTMATCPNGHHYDAAKHGACPYCGAGGFTPTEAPGMGGGAMGGFTPTEPLGGGMGGASPAFSPTEAPSAAAGGVQPNFGATTPPDSYRGAGAVNPFSVETTIGGVERGSGQAEPVVGWLVCSEGPMRGTDFRLHAGYNYIGREAGDVRLRGDQQISRQNHAMIAYDSSERAYFVGPAAGRNLIKVNGKTVLNAIEIHSYDVISIGTTRLIFVALCGEHFSWEGPEDGNG